MPSSITYAIDFGTSNSLLAAANSEEIFTPIPLDHAHHSDSTILRSLMYFPKSGEPLFGVDAINKYTSDAGEGRFIRSIKKYLPSKTFKGTQIGSKVYGLEDLISRFLREMKLRADRHFDQDVTSVVLGKPARFSMEEEKEELAKARLKSAAEKAGFEKIEFLEEPLAAAYSYKSSIEGEKNLLVVDLGGGTSDFTVVKLHSGEFSDQDVLSIGGVSVAGDALDGSMMSKLISHNFGSEIQYQFPMSSNVLTMPPVLKSKLSTPADITLMGRSDIMDFLQQVKKCNITDEARGQLEQLDFLIKDNLGFSIFSEIENTKVEVCAREFAEFLFETDEIFVKEEIKYSQFSDAVSPKIEKIFNCLDETLNSSGLRPDQIDLICMTGGTSKVPLVKAGLVERFGEDKVSNFKNFHSVILGLSERARRL